MSNRHSAGTAVQWRVTRPALVGICVLVLAVVAASVVAIRNFGSSTTAAPVCGRSISIRIAAAPALVKPLQTYATKWNDIGFVRDGKCIVAQVVSATPATEEALLAAGSADRPAVWVPDSSAWVQRLQSDLSTRNQDRHITNVNPHGSMASSPIVLVSSPARAAKFASGGGVTWASIVANGTGLSIENPLVDSDGLVGLMAVQTALGATSGFSLSSTIASLAPTPLTSADAGFQLLRTDPDNAPLFLASEQEVITANRASGRTVAAATYPTDGTLSLDFPAVRLDYPGDDAAVASAADGFYSSFVAGAATEVNPVGLRNGAGETKPVPGGDVSTSALAFTKLPEASLATANAVWSAWPTQSRNPRMLFALDASSLMSSYQAEDVPVINAEAQSAVALAASFLPDSASVGMWRFAGNLTDTHDWAEVVGIGPLGNSYNGTQTRRQFVQQQANMTAEGNNSSAGLYDTALDSFYYLTNNFEEGRANVVVLMTGGSNRDASGINLDQLLTTLRQQYNAAKPVKIITIAVGGGADNTALSLIAAATNGQSFQAHSVEDALNDLVSALVQEQPR